DSWPGCTAALARASTRPRSSPHQTVGTWREQLLDRHRFRDDPLSQGVADELLQNLSVRRDAIGQRVAGDLHHPPVYLVNLGRLVDLAALEAVDVTALGFSEGVEYFDRQIGMRGNELVPDHDGVTYS